MAALAALVSLAWAVPAGAVENVTTTADGNDGECAVDCTLREAFDVASEGEQINVPAGTYLLSLGEIAIPTNVTAVGAGAGRTIVDAQGNSRVFHVAGTGSANPVALNSMTIRNGRVAGNGGGILNDGAAALRLTGTVVSGNRSEPASGVSTGGGGIYNNSAGGLFVTASTVAGNVYAGGAVSISNGGGGIFNQLGSVTITGSTVSGNSAAIPTPGFTPLSNGGGGVRHDATGGTLTATDSVFNDNSLVLAGMSLSNGGGAIYAADGAVTLTRTSFNRNSANVQATGQANGGGTLWLTAGGQITDSAIAGSVLDVAGSITNGGGAIFSNGGTLALDGSSVTGSRADVQGSSLSNGGGGIFQQGGSVDLGTSSVRDNGVVVTGTSNLGGGGVFLGGGATIAATASTLSGNTVDATAIGTGFNSGGGAVIVSTAGASFVNSTISGNRMNLTGATDVSIGGGGLMIDAGGATLTNVTVAGNTTNGFGGGVRHHSGTDPTLRSSILAGNSGNGANCSGTFASAGFNVESADTCGLGAGERRNTDPRLGPLAANGGPTPTRALLPGSPAIDTAPAASCPPTDQRGAARQGACDSGAYEFDALSSTAGSPTCAPTGVIAVTVTPPPGSSAAAVRSRVDGGPERRTSVTGAPATALVPVPVGRHTLQYWGELAGGRQELARHSQALTVPACEATTSLPAPRYGVSFNAEVLSGQVFYSAPRNAVIASRLGVLPAQRTVPGLKGRRFLPLRSARQLPVGTLLDTRKGRVRLTTSRDPAGTSFQSGVFRAGVFQTLQSRRRSARGLTELRLKGSSFRRCARRHARGSRVEAARHRLSRRRVRRLRSNARGRFRTRGRYSAATVRGTIWETTDRCDGTLTRVSRGRVLVRDFRRRKSVLLRAGKRYLARARR